VRKLIVIVSRIIPEIGASMGAEFAATRDKLHPHELKNSDLIPCEFSVTGNRTAPYSQAHPIFSDFLLFPYQQTAEITNAVPPVSICTSH
jgi:hypothetical protein